MPNYMYSNIWIINIETWFHLNKCDHLGTSHVQLYIVIPVKSISDSDDYHLEGFFFSFPELVVIILPHTGLFPKSMELPKL